MHTIREPNTPLETHTIRGTHI